MNIQMKNLSIRGVSAVVPKNKLDLEVLENKFGLNEIKRIMMSTGIESHQRHGIKGIPGSVKQSGIPKGSRN